MSPIADTPVATRLVGSGKCGACGLSLRTPPAARAMATKANGRLLRACSEAWYHVRIRELLAEGGSPHARDPDGQTPLHHSSFVGDAKVCELLLDAGADPNAVNSFTYTPLHYAAAQGNDAVVRLLVARGGEVNARSDRGTTPVRFAHVRGQRSTEDLLISLGARDAHL